MTHVGAYYNTVAGGAIFLQRGLRDLIPQLTTTTAHLSTPPKTIVSGKSYFVGVGKEQQLTTDKGEEERAIVPNYIL